MIRTLSALGWLFVALDVIGAIALVVSRDSGDAATRGVGQGLGAALAVLAAVSALLLWVGRAPERSLFAVIGILLAIAPVGLGLAVKLSKQGLGLIYPSMRVRDVPMEPSAQYAFPDAAGREAALAIVYNDYAKLDTLLRATPPPDLAAHDERGESLLGLATRAAIAGGNSTRDLEGLRFVLAAGARPRSDDLGPEQSLLEMVAGAHVAHAPTALAMLLDAGLNVNSPMSDGRSVLFSDNLTPAAARVLLAHGIDTAAHDTRGGAADWSPVTYHADAGRWATAMALLEGGVPRDYGSPSGSVLARVLSNNDARITDADRKDAAYAALMAAIRP